LASERDALRIEPATADDVPLLLRFIRDVVATEADLRRHRFGPAPAARAVIARIGDEAAGFALYFFSFSTFLAKPGLYLEDLFVRPAWRGRGIGRALLAWVAHAAVEHGCGRMEWSVLNWNELALRVYRGIGAQPMSEWTVQRLTGEDLIRLAAGAPAAPPRSTT
jgi:GNAT superfamily N-acetyltransferase